MPRTLAPFMWLLAGKKEIQCPRIYLDGWFDSAVPLFEGSGTLTISGTADFSFHVHAKPLNEKEALKALKLSSDRLYDPQTAFRLRAVDYSGIEWNGGWVRPRLGEVQGGYWELICASAGLTTMVQQDEPVSGVELVYSPAPEVPFSEVITTTAHLGETRIGWRTSGGRHAFELLGGSVEVRTEPWSNELRIVASTSKDLNHPYLENWLSEPLRALRGQLIFPRLVARNFADGRASVSIRQAPPIERSLGGCVTQLSSGNAGEFWKFYEHYLAYIAQHRSKDGHPEFEANPLTRFHDEVIQAHLAGSHWVLALSIASAIEGIVKMGSDFEKTSPDFTEGDLFPVTQFLAKLTPADLRSRLSSMTSLLRRPSVARYLAQLSNAGQLDTGHVSAWKNIRNRVAHGNLFEPWGTEADDTQLMKLVELLYRLTAIRIGYTPDTNYSSAVSSE